MGHCLAIPGRLGGRLPAADAPAPRWDTTVPEPLPTGTPPIWSRPAYPEQSGTSIALSTRPAPTQPGRDSQLHDAIHARPERLTQTRLAIFKVHNRCSAGSRLPHALRHATGDQDHKIACHVLTWPGVAVVGRARAGRRPGLGIRRIFWLSRLRSDRRCCWLGGRRLELPVG
jgi:hypothetical protein